jgi:hypothetical protein
MLFRQKSNYKIEQTFFQNMYDFRADSEKYNFFSERPQEIFITLDIFEQWAKNVFMRNKK